MRIFHFLFCANLVQRADLTHAHETVFLSVFIVLIFFCHKNRVLIQGVKDKLEPLIQKYVQSSGGAFVKLSTRSPKEVHAMDR